MSGIGRKRGHGVALTMARVLVGTLGLLALPPAAHAAVIYSTFGAGDSYDTSVGAAVLGPNSGSVSQWTAASFDVAQDVELTGFEIAAKHLRGSNSYLFSVVQDNGGLPTGSSLFSTGGALTTVSSVHAFGASGSLLAGNRYWLLMLPGANDTFGLWNLNNLGVKGFAYDGGLGWVSAPDTPTPAFRISGTVRAVPEPAASLLAIAGLAAAAGRAGYRRRKTVGLSVR